jgi:CheY-like chemotaxis protein/signal transduction histidine kinase
MIKFTFSNIQSKLIFWFLLLALSPLLTGTLVTYFSTKKSFEASTYDKLSAIRDLKVGQVKNWITERKGDFNVFTKNTDQKLLNEALSGSSVSPRVIESRNHIRNIFHNYQNSYAMYEEIFVIDVRSGLVEISTDQNNEGHEKSSYPYYSGALKSNEIFIGNIFYSVESGSYLLPISSVLYQSGDVNSEKTGVLVAFIDVNNSLYALLNNWTGLGKTGETLIVDTDRVVQNELRWRENAPLRLQLKTLPAIYSSQGKNGVLSHLDYRGEKVLSAYTFIPETSWGFICKQDQAELDQPVSTMTSNLILLLILTGFVVSIIVYFLGKSISSPILQLFNHSTKIGEGNYVFRNSISSKNELGKLGNAINTMVENIESKIAIQIGVASMSEAVIGHKTRGQYVGSILRQLIKITDANMVAFYILNKDETAFDHYDSIGANKNLLQPFRADYPEGQFGYALADKKIHVLKNLPSDTVFRFNTTTGEITPREIITIPVIDAGGKVIAMVSLASISAFNNNMTDVLRQSWNMLNISYANLLAAEQTAILADTLTISNQKLEAQSEELQSQSEELQEQANELQHGTEELQLQNQELEMQRLQVEEATRLKSEFLSNMSHELRTPLNSINALSHVLIRQAKHKLSSEENEYLEVVERNGKRLLSLINDILDLSKIEAGKIELQPRSLSLSAMLRQVTDNILPLAKQKSIALTCTTPDKPIEIETDENRLNQILTNIIGNAVKFTDTGGVEITAETDATGAYIKVKDSGIGISEDVLPYIFDEFRQADGSTSRSYEGTGLGLAIARKLVQALHGRISVDSKFGKGTVFTVSLPVKWAGRFENEPLSWVHKQAAGQNRKTILIVDDDPKIINQIASCLESFDYHTIGTTSGMEALKLAELYRPYAITLDIVMPDMDGLEVLQHLNANPVTSDIPVIMISVSDDKQTSFALGAIGYVTKPVDRLLLIKEIRKLNAHAFTIMVVDDNPIDRKQIHDILQQENLEDIQVEDGRKCLEMIQLKQPDVLVLDLMMPGLDGFQVLEELRKRPETRDLPVIVVTAKDLTQDEKEILSGKVQKVLTKSTIAPLKIYQEIRRILDQITWKSSATLKQSASGVHKRILMVEDNQAAVIQVKKILEREDITVDVAYDGPTALEYVKHTIPDGLILDLMMPGMDGFELLEIIRSTRETRHLPVLILTARNLTNDDFSRLSANNVRQLIQKGDVNPSELLNKVKMMLGLVPAQIQTTYDPPVLRPDYKQDVNQVITGSQKRKILVIEDNADNRLTVRALLQEIYFLIDADNGEEGVEKTLEMLPDLVLLDISLPKMNGFEVIKILKNNEKTKNIPVIALTAKAMKSDREAILEAGCDEYIAKPIDQEELLLKIENLLRNK